MRVGTVIEEGFLRFDFSEEWYVIKYDVHPDYVDHIKNLAQTKAVDFEANHLLRQLFLIEVKDFRGHRIENRKRINDGDLAVEVGQKVRDTISGIIAANSRGNTATWAAFTRCLANPETPLKVILWLEEDLPPGPSGRAENRTSVKMHNLKRQLRWLTARVFVSNIAENSLVGINVSNLRGAGYRA